MAGLERTLALWVFGYVEPGTTAAATVGMRQPIGFGTGVGAPLGPSRSHGFGPGGGWTFFGDFRLFDIHILLKTMDIPGHKILCVLEPGRKLPPFPPYTSRIRAPYSRTRQTVLVAAMSSLVSPAPSAFAFRRRSARIRCTRRTRSARGMPRRRAISG